MTKSDWGFSLFPFSLLLAVCILFVSCGGKEVILEFETNKEPVFREVKLYKDSTFSEVTTETEGKFKYEGIWEGSTSDSGVFHLFLTDSIAGVQLLVLHASFRVSNGEVSEFNARE